MNNFAVVLIAMLVMGIGIPVYRLVANIRVDRLIERRERAYACRLKYEARMAAFLASDGDLS